MGWRNAGLSKSLFSPTSAASLLPPRAVPTVPARQGHPDTLSRDVTPRGGSGIIPVLQKMWGQCCCHKPSPSASTLQPRARAALWLERVLTPGKHPSAPALLLNLLPKHLLLTTARHRGTQPSVPNQALEAFRDAVTISENRVRILLSQLLPELQRHPCCWGSSRKALRNVTTGTEWRTGSESQTLTQLWSKINLPPPGCPCAHLPGQPHLPALHTLQPPGHPLGHPKGHHTTATAEQPQPHTATSGWHHSPHLYREVLLPSFNNRRSNGQGGQGSPSALQLDLAPSWRGRGRAA